jgi:hypothetical protein
MSRRISNNRLQGSRTLYFKIILSLILGGLPLLAYAGVVVGGLISLSGVWTGDEPLLLVIVAKSTIIGSISYPLVYLVSVVATVVMAKTKRMAIAFKISLVPLAYLLVLGLLVIIWIWLNQTG